MAVNDEKSMLSGKKNEKEGALMILIPVSNSAVMKYLCMFVPTLGKMHNSRFTVNEEQSTQYWHGWEEKCES